MQQDFDVSGALAASVVVAGASLSARLVVWLPTRHLHGWLPWLQATAAGLLIGDALLHMLPEAMARGITASQAGGRIALGVLCLLALECVVRAVRTPSSTAAFARMNIIGDTLHHFVDGIVIGASFAIDPTLGMIVALAIMAHELPREMGNAGVLVAGGYLPRRAFALSVATTAALPLGALAMTTVGLSHAFLGTSLALAAGTTLYLACGDVLPGMWQALDKRHRFTPALGVAAGLVFMWAAALLDQGR
ncbi:ZIP family metal transporter [Dyella jejuensis]|uniref:ZIP family metal transporter n=1 Tax=Dyella jejuensis TaxID=1432009 RepID=A0ABW8JM24_9GAMM